MDINHSLTLLHSVEVKSAYCISKIKVGEAKYVLHSFCKIGMKLVICGELNVLSTGDV